MHGDAGFRGLDDELVAGIGDERRSGVGDQRERLAGRKARKDLGPDALGVVLVIGGKPRRNPVVVEQMARVAGILGQDQVDARQRLQRADGDVAEIADWRRDVYARALELSRGRAP